MRAMKNLGSIGIVLGAATLAAACLYDDPTPAPPAYPPPAMVPASGGVLSPEQAASALSGATCDREARCNGIGPGARHATYDQCLSVNYQVAMDNFKGCGYGVKDRELQACRNEILRHGCGGMLSPLEWFQRAVTCQTSNLCLR